MVHDRNLGTEGLAGGFRSQIEALSQAIHDLVTLPLKDGIGASLNQISALVLLGESADNEQLQKALKEALREHVLGKQLVTLVSLAEVARETNIDPLFAAANRAA